MAKKKWDSQGLALSRFLFALEMDRLRNEVRQELAWTVMFADGILSYNESREEVEACYGEKRHDSQ